MTTALNHEAYMYDRQLICPICGYQSSKFEDYKGKYHILGKLVDCFTRNSICPECHSDMRHRFLYKYLLQHTDFSTSQIKLLHFAPERWLAKKILEMNNIDYHPVDINPDKFDYMDVMHANITELPFESDSFDALILIHVLEHIADDDEAIRELYRVLRPGGWCVIAVPTIGEKTHFNPNLDERGREKMYGIGDHYRLYGTDLAQKLESFGFVARVIEFSDIGCDFVDLEQSSPHIESDKYIFYCENKAFI